MASRIVLDPIPLWHLQRHHHGTLNTFGDGETLVDAISNRPGIYGPNPIAHLSLLARRPSLTVSDLEEALLNDRTLVRAGAFRGSLFLLVTEDYPLYFRALNQILSRAQVERLEAADITERHLLRFTQRLKDADFAMPLPHDDLMEIMFPAREKRPPVEIERLVLRKLCDRGVLMRTTSKGWKGNRFYYALLSRWLPDVRLSAENPEPARTETVRRYLRTYGPATLEDIAWWTGLQPLQVQRAVTHLGREVLRYPVIGLPEGLVGLRETVDAFRKDRPAFDDVQFLPLWDTYTLGWKDKRRLVDEDLMPWVYDNAGNAASVIIHDGKVVGIWQFRDSERIILEFHLFDRFADLKAKVHKKAGSHAAALALTARARETVVVERDLPLPLEERERNAFLWPLGKELPFRSGDQGLMLSPMDRRTPNTYRGSYLDSKQLVKPEAEEQKDRRAAARKASAKAEKNAQESATTKAKPAKKVPAKKKPAKKKPAKKKPAKKKPAKKKPAKKKPAKKKPAKKKPAKKKPAKKKPAKKKPAKKKPAKKRPAKKKPAKKKTTKKRK
jgi:hypothetical protein